MKIEKNLVTFSTGRDPPGTARVEVQCPDCDAGDFCESRYFDAKGEQIFVRE